MVAPVLASAAACASSGSNTRFERILPVFFLSGVWGEFRVRGVRRPQPRYPQKPLPRTLHVCLLRFLRRCQLMHLRRPLPRYPQKPLPMNLHVRLLRFLQMYQRPHCRKPHHRLLLPQHHHPGLWFLPQLLPQPRFLVLAWQPAHIW